MTIVKALAILLVIPACILGPVALAAAGLWVADWAKR